MTTANRVSAFLAYVPVIGWLYVVLLRRDDPLAMFHARQAIGLLLFLLAVVAGWALGSWLLAWIPFAFLLAVSLFSLVIIALLFGVIAWGMGMVNALRGRVALLPIFGKMANRLPL